MNGVQELINFLYYTVLGVGCTVKIIAILATSLSEEDKTSCFKKIKNVIIFFIVAISLSTVYELVTRYMGTL